MGTSFGNVPLELEKARRARAAGNEGRARVCARRAAGWVAREYLTAREIPAGSDAFEALQSLMSQPGLAPDLRRAAEELTRRVDQDFSLPDGMDLIAAAVKLIAGLK
jgi:hypothetical protein